METLKLGIGQYGTVNRPGQVIATHALGSCVAVVVLDTGAKVIGMIHLALPDSTLHAARAAKLPGYFADSGLPVLCESLRQAGSGLNPSQLVVKVIGGANLMATNATFQIGNRNIEAVKQQLAKLGWKISAEDTGGNISRTVTVSTSDGKVVVTSPGAPPRTI